MNEAVSFLPLIGILVIVVGFVLRFNAILVVLIAAFVTRWTLFLASLARALSKPVRYHLLLYYPLQPLAYLSVMD